MSFINTTPVSKRQDPVFKTPMSYSPHITGEKVRPSPSRIELWKEELGLDGDGSTSDDDSTNSDEEPEVDQNTNKLVTCSVLEYEALQKELEERNSQRDDLLYRLKTLTDKNKSYKNRLEREEASKKQQLKIMRRTHEAHQQEKDTLIKTLEEIIEEQDQKVAQLESQLKGESSEESPPPSKSVQLIQQLTRLQDEKTHLTRQVLQLEADVETTREKLQDDSTTQKDRHAKLEQENATLQDELIKLRSLKNTGSTDAEKMVCTLELDNDKLRREMRDLKHQVIQAESDMQTAQDDAHLKKLKEENDQLRERLESLETKLSSRNQETDETEERLRNEVKQLTNENQALSREVRELAAKLTALQAKSPEVVTRVQKVKVEVESSGVKVALQQAQDQNKKLQDDITRLQGALSQATSKSKEVQRIQSEAQEERERLQSQVKTLEGQTEQLQQQRDIANTQLGESAQQLEQLHSVSSEKQQLQCEVKQLQSQCDTTSEELASSKGMVSTLQQQIETYQEEMQNLERELREEMEALRRRKEEEAELAQQHAEEKLSKLSHSMVVLKDKMSVIRPEMIALVREYNALKKQCQGMPQLVKHSIKEATKQLCKSIEDIHKYNQELVHKYRKEMSLRKKYHNELVELKGNIRVFGRVRPVIKEDGSGPQAECVTGCDAEDDGLINILYKSRQQTFELDRAFDPSITQPEVFSEVQSLVTSCIDGYNVCIFAYGQTGSGKTFTMEGTKADPGINQRALQMLFQETEERSAEWDWTISVSVMEIYNEMLRDLLSRSHADKLEIKMGGERGLYVPGLTEIVVKNVHDVNKIFSMGHENRHTASTNMNEHSSRSHAILTINLVGQSKTTGTKTLGKLNLVDLAGSERVSKSGADGTRLKEAQNINKSLSCLGDVIHALRGKQSHVPYRNSKLTYLLQDSLGGDSKTLMIVQISPVEKNVGETLASLNFAQRVRSVELGQATKKVESAIYEDHVNHNNNLMNGKSGSTSKLPSATPSKIARKK